ncbi:indole-3-glycerol-phosphate synthase [Marine Group I thaumarchaeote]|jgi:indole-3-glycerol phosphate synthase|uniref:indole-3-glycerol-phosphate synthase n=1 Tax=Marine Group I thaumarchaeote TaxID=2511932 RepID=A0A7K4N7E0_9ARCH|nr:MAG: indole-3-glycerol-phosphate synthase [Nitrosopumilus sp. YT1]NMI82593.1 indole-3-glycerol-phosphate synthase [Candidatus Nitrosopumilus sp. MTA1]NWJ20637.1 indole-3-glycerol-phosphate synthase [Marine Group I thaumarchaeote]NWJ28791.1 indole-3-glycerol-phosphate synthase [Marine Group I thaumarchaeote]NWJ57219.1 indole-3-glycerol-phosphate synthase [Marine Group I thaumarchaeote]
MAENILKRLVTNSQTAIDDGTYEIDVNLQKSSKDFIQIIKNNSHPTLLTEIKFASPSLGKIRTLTDPASIARQMIAGGSKALSILTQPNLFHGSPEYFMKVRESVDIPLLMKDIMIENIQIDAAEKMGADYILLIQSLFDQGFLKEIDEFIEYAHKKELKILLEVHTKQEFENALKTDADLIGVNNRNLDTLEIDLKTTKTVLEGYEKSRPILSESGIETTEDIQYLKKSGADAFLVGSSIMKSDNIEEQVRKLVKAY